jgi:hypothetical protein
MQNAVIVLTTAAALLIGRTTVSGASPVEHWPTGWNGYFATPLAISSDEETWVSVNEYTNQGDFLRENPDGTLFLHLNVRVGVVVISRWKLIEGYWKRVERYVGLGDIFCHYSAVVNDGWIQWDGNRMEWRITGDMQPWNPDVWEPLSDELYPFTHQWLARDWKDVLYKLSFEPFGWDVKSHK